MKTLLALAFTALAALPLGAHAASQDIYKSWLPDGSVTYAAQPEPNATKVERIDVQTLSPEQRRAAQRLLLMDQASIKKGYAILEREWTAVDDGITRAQNALRRAERALRNGRTPLPGERRGNVGGGSRLDAKYFARIHRLEQAVKATRERLDKAYQARNNLRG
ncbi:MAG: DUF4124 domain-containing protein [Burkholderiales bacterium]